MKKVILLLLMILPEVFTKFLLNLPSSSGVKIDPKQWLLCKLSPADILGEPGMEPEEVRKNIEITSGARILPNTDKVFSRDHSLKTSGDHITIREYFSAETEKSKEAIMYFHGGGWVVCSLESHDQLCKFICNYLGIRVFSVGYRLAPEHKYPIPLDDCYHAWDWLCCNFKDLGLKLEKVSVGGDSAGGHLATTLCHKLLRENYKFLPYSQLLICPVIEPFATYSSYKEFGEGFYLSSRAMAWFSDCYIPKEVERDDSCIWPLKARKWEGFPKVFMISAGFDVLSEEASYYSKKLNENGVNVSHKIYKNCIHDFPMFSFLPRPKRYFEECLDLYKAF